MADVWIDGVYVGYCIEVRYAEITRDNLERAWPQSCHLWPPERLTELEQANQWRPTAENEAMAYRGL